MSGDVVNSPNSPMSQMSMMSPMSPMGGVPLSTMQVPVKALIRNQRRNLKNHKPETFVFEKNMTN